MPREDSCREEVKGQRSRSIRGLSTGSGAVPSLRLRRLMVDQVERKKLVRRCGRPVAVATAPNKPNDDGRGHKKQTFKLLCNNKFTNVAFLGLKGSRFALGGGDKVEELTL